MSSDNGDVPRLIYAPADSVTDAEVTVSGRNGMVVSSNPLAAQAGLRILAQGGNAVDAAVTVSATLGVVEPYMSGAGGIGYMVIYRADDEVATVLDFVGRSPYATEPSTGQTQPPPTEGLATALVPGSLGGWLAALDRYGTMSRAEVFAPAIEYARHGFPLTRKAADYFRQAASRLALDAEAARVLLPGGAAPVAGNVLVQRDLAETYELIVRQGAVAFYTGEIAQAIVARSQRTNGLLSERDLAEFAPAWHHPVTASYRGYTVVAPPPPSGGFQYLEALNVLEGFDLASLGHNSTAYAHLAIEAFKLAMADRVSYGVLETVPLETLLSKEYAARQRERLDLSRAACSSGDRFPRTGWEGLVQSGVRNPGLTTHFCVMDRWGNGVSSTQSLGKAFGGCAMVPGTGLVLNDFMWWFDTQPDSPNARGPHRRVDMCLAPSAVLQNGHLRMLIGTPGSQGILQTTPQMIVNVLDFGLSMQAAIDAPRFVVLGQAPYFDPYGTPYDARLVGVEDRIGEDVLAGLVERGHVIEPLGDWSHTVGAGAGILVGPDGVLTGGADRRRDGHIAAW